MTMFMLNFLKFLPATTRPCNETCMYWLIDTSLPASANAYKSRILPYNMIVEETFETRNRLLQRYALLCMFHILTYREHILTYRESSTYTMSIKHFLKKCMPHGICVHIPTLHERWGAGVETQKNVRGEIGGWGRVPFNEPYAPSLSTIYDGA